MKPILLSLLALAAPAAAQSSRAWLIDSDLDRLYSVNLANGRATPIGSTSGTGLDTPAGLAWRQDTRTLWTIDQQGGEVGTLDTTTGAFTPVFTAVPANGWEGIAHDPMSGVFYLIHQDFNLYALSPATGTTRLIGPTGANRITSLESDASGNLWGIGFVTGILFRINKTTGAATTVVATSPVHTESIAFAPDGRLYATNSTTDSLYTVNPTTGAMTLIGAHGAGVQTAKGLEIETIPASVAYSGSGCPSPGAMSYYELFGTFDLANTGLQMVPSGPGYQVTATAATVVPPFSFDLGLGDDSVSNPLPLPFLFAFPGGSTQGIRVCSNGFIHLNANNTSARFNPNAHEVLNDGPHLYPLWMDLSPSQGAGSIHVDNDIPNNRVVITWLNVPEFRSSTNRCTAQVILYASGVVEYRWGAAANTQGAALVGFSPGANNRDPGNRDISATLPFSTQVDDALVQGSDRPVLGRSVHLVVTGIPAGSIVGFELIGVALPAPGIDLTPSGMPGCSLHVLPILFALQFSTDVPTRHIMLPLPNDPSLLGSEVSIQALVVTPGINAAGLVTSNLATLTIGDV